jgi:hypothetical protein
MSGEDLAEEVVNITSPISQTGRTSPPLNAPSPVWKKIYVRALAGRDAALRRPVIAAR